MDLANARRQLIKCQPFNFTASVNLKEIQKRVVAAFQPTDNEIFEEVDEKNPRQFPTAKQRKKRTITNASEQIEVDLRPL